MNFEQARCSKRWQNTDLDNRKPLRMKKGVWWDAIKLMGGLYFEISAILCPNPYTGKIEMEQKTVVIKEKELNCI